MSGTHIPQDHPPGTWDPLPVERLPEVSLGFIAPLARQEIVEMQAALAALLDRVEECGRRQFQVRTLPRLYRAKVNGDNADAALAAFAEVRERMDYLQAALVAGAMKAKAGE